MKDNEVIICHKGNRYCKMPMCFTVIWSIFYELAIWSLYSQGHMSPTWDMWYFYHFSPSDIGLCGVCSSLSPCLSAKAFSSCARWPYSSCGPYKTTAINSSSIFYICCTLCFVLILQVCVCWPTPSTCFLSSTVLSSVCVGSATIHRWDRLQMNWRGSLGYSLLQWCY